MRSRRTLVTVATRSQSGAAAEGWLVSAGCVRVDGGAHLDHYDVTV